LIVFHCNRHCDRISIHARCGLCARDLIRSRRRLGLSQSELARRAGVRVGTLNRIERAKITASQKVMEKLDAVLGETRML